jgi:putative flippase GtrA
MTSLTISGRARFRELLSYGIVGVFSTILNIILYTFFTKILLLHYLVSTAGAFCLATLFAYFGNKFFVFRSNQRRFIVEIALFFGLRLVMGALDFFIMYVSVDLLRQNDMIMKIVSNGIVIAGNYLCSKILIFKKKTAEKDSRQ